ncbi:MAG: hypothetical protein LC749_21485, partial [Actinobacteria bacterium]|nr:hypothetical protein [Actinomycetota bacterium]
SRPRHAKTARSQYGSHRAADPEPGALPPRSTATTLTDPIEGNSATRPGQPWKTLVWSRWRGGVDDQVKGS